MELTDKKANEINQALKELAKFIDKQPDWFKKELDYRLKNKEKGSKIKKTKKPCPSCNGTGKSYGYNYCGTCKGKNWIIEKEKIE